MIYIFIIFHLLLIIESLFLFKKKQRKKSLYIFIMNLILMIMNIVKLSPTLSKEMSYSSVVYMTSLLKNHAISTIFWIVLNIIFIGICYYIINLVSKKKKQNPLLKVLIYSASYFILFYFSIILFNKIAAILLLIGIIITLIYLIKVYIKEKQNYVLASMIIISIFTIYTFCFYTGAARLQIALLGYPIEAYNTGLEEMKFYKEENIKKYMPIEEIKMENNSLGMVQVKNYIGIKIGTYYEY